MLPVSIYSASGSGDVMRRSAAAHVSIFVVAVVDTRVELVLYASRARWRAHLPVALSRPFSHPSSMLMRTYPSLVNPLEMKYSVTFWMCASVSQHHLESKKKRDGERGGGARVRLPHTPKYPNMAMGVDLCERCAQGSCVAERDVCLKTRARDTVRERDVSLSPVSTLKNSLLPIRSIVAHGAAVVPRAVTHGWSSGKPIRQRSGERRENNCSQNPQNSLVLRLLAAVQ